MAAPKTRYVRADSSGGGNGSQDVTSGPNAAYTWAEFLANLPRYGDTYYIKGPYTYTFTSDLNLYAGHGSSSPITIEGYYNTPGDNPTGNNRPKFACGAYELEIEDYTYFKNFRITTSDWSGCWSHGPGIVVINCSSYNSYGTSGYAAFSGGDGVWIDCDGRSRNGAAFRGSGRYIGCVAYNSEDGFDIPSSVMIECVAYGCTNGLWQMWQRFPTLAIRNTFYNCSDAVHGFMHWYETEGELGVYLGNVFDSCVNGVVYDIAGGRQLWLDFNNFNNISGDDVSGVDKGDDWSNDDPGFFSTSGLDFRIGPGVKGQGFPKWQNLFDHILDPDVEGWSDQGALQRLERIGEVNATQEVGPDARSGSSCVKLEPKSTVHASVWEFQVYAANGVPMTCNFWHKITSGFNGSLAFSASGQGVTPIVDDTVTLVDDGAYHEYISPSMTSTSDGFLTIRLKFLDGAVSGDIFIDDITTESA